LEGERTSRKVGKWGPEGTTKSFTLNKYIRKKEHVVLTGRGKSRAAEKRGGANHMKRKAVRKNISATSSEDYGEKGTW